MAFRKGQSGNPTGKRKEKQFYDALNAELKACDDARGLRAIARRLIDNALAGDMQAINAVANRLDGMPAQEVEGNFTINDARELTDAELANIARGGGAGIADEESGPEKPALVH